MVKVSAICVENSREVAKSEKDIVSIKNFFVFALRFFYNINKQHPEEFIGQSIGRIM